MIIVGGTFDQIHKGHRALLDKAIQLAYLFDEKLVVCVTEDLISAFKSHPINTYADRKAAIECYLLDQMLPINYKIYKLHNHPSEKIIGEFESAKSITMVVSPESYHGALATMTELHVEMTVVIIPIVKSSDGKKISSTRVRSNEINLEGNVI